MKYQKYDWSDILESMYSHSVRITPSEIHLISNNNNMFKLNWINIKSAIVYIVLTAVLGLLAYIVGVGDVFKIDFHSVVNIFAISVATGIVSIIKNLLTDNSGAFLGGIQVIPPTD